MTRTHSIAFHVLASCGIIGIAMAAPLPLAPIQKAMKDRTGAFVIIDCASGEVTDLDAKASAEKLSPCSTFKIFVGFVESGERCFAFAAALQGTEASGAETRSLVETILLDLNLLNRQTSNISP